MLRQASVLFLAGCVAALLVQGARIYQFDAAILVPSELVGSANFGVPLSLARLVKPVGSIDHDVEMAPRDYSFERVDELAPGHGGFIGTKFHAVLIRENESFADHANARPARGAWMAPTFPIRATLNVSKAWQLPDIFDSEVDEQPTTAALQIKAVWFQGDFHIWPDSNFICCERGLNSPIGGINAVFGLHSRINTGGHDKNSQQRIDADAYSGIAGPAKYLTLMLLAVGLGGFILFLKGIYGESDLALFGGWFLAAIAGVLIVIWYISGHFPNPFAERVSACRGIDASAPCYSRSKHVGVEAVIIPELKLGDVERQILGADFVERAHDAALNQRPEAVDCLGVDGTEHVLAERVFDRKVGIFHRQALVSLVIVGRQQANLIGHNLANEFVQCGSIGVIDDARDDIALPLDGASNDHLALVAAHALTLTKVFVFAFAADERFIDLDNAAELLLGMVQQGSADFVTHGMGCAVGAEAHHPLDLQGRHAFFAGEHEMDDAARSLGKTVKPSAL